MFNKITSNFEAEYIKIMSKWITTDKRRDNLELEDIFICVGMVNPTDNEETKATLRKAILKACYDLEPKIISNDTREKGVNDGKQ